MADAPELWVCDLGTVEYRAATALQEAVRERRTAEEIPDVLLLLEHPAVYTLGRRSEPGDLPMGRDWCRARGIDVVETRRGGKLTYHGPGQLVGYPIMRIDDVIDFLRTMEAALVAALADMGIAATGAHPAARPTATPRAAAQSFTGAWVGERKIASIGIHVRKGVTMHGFAVNVDNDLAPFEWVVPCGLDGVRMTSVARETGGPERLPAFRRAAAERFAAAHGRRLVAVSPERLGAASAPAPAAGALR